MPNPKQPIQLIQAKGKKHLTKAEIEERSESEPQPNPDGIAPPYYLTTKEQKSRFSELSEQLKVLGVMGNTDCDALARYVIAEEMYVSVTKMLRKPGVLKDIERLKEYTSIQDKYFKQCRAAANDLGLSISARCRLIVPKTTTEPPKNKFERFQNTQAG